MPTHAVVDKTEAEDLIRGLTLLGTGGGGTQQMGRRRLLAVLRSGKSIQWIDPSEVADDGWTCSGFGMGSIAPQRTMTRDERLALGYGDIVSPEPLVEAIRYLGNYREVDIQVLVPFELGAGNTTAPLFAAAILGLPVVDGDYAGGRAVPELAVVTPVVKGHAFHPATICDPWGNRILVQSTPSVAVAERLGKAISGVTRLPDPLAACAHAGFLLCGADMKECLVPGTLTRALHVGQAIRLARQQGQDPVTAAVEVLKGWVLIRGTVIKKEWHSNGYMIGETTIQGMGASSGHTLRLWFKNENLMSWMDDKPYVTCPDLLCVMDQATGEPYTNTILAEGNQVAVLASRAAEIYRTGEGLRLMGPAHFGFGCSYRAVETQM